MHKYSAESTSGCADTLHKHTQYTYPPTQRATGRQTDTNIYVYTWGWNTVGGILKAISGVPYNCRHDVYDYDIRYIICRITAVYRL